MASSFLQLLDSPWLPTSFHKKDVIFLRDEKSAQRFRIDRPHVSRDIHNESENERFSDCHEKANFSDPLDHLGIMLLELCFGRILEDQPCRKGWPVGGNEKERAVFDVMAARAWQCHVIEEAGFDFAEAIGWCLGGNRSTPPDRWRQEMLRKVVQPLQRCRDILVHGFAAAP
jgi:hypothetical protein